MAGLDAYLDEPDAGERHTGGAVLPDRRHGAFLLVVHAGVNVGCRDGSVLQPAR